MPTPHINANNGDFAKVVLMPGDPVRAKWIAETFLTDIKLVNEVRGILAYTGKTKDGKLLSVMASGMGMPSIGIYSHELYTSFGVELIIRVGTCGTYQPYVNLEDVIIATGASTDSNWVSQHRLNGSFSALADFEASVTAKLEAEKLGLKVHGGNIFSADVFYDHDPELWKKWAKFGILGVEMESYALYTNAALLNKKALCLLTVTDSFLNRDEKLTSDQRATGLKNMVELAIAVAEKYCD